MDKVFYNGCIRTLDDNDSIAQAVGITDGKITFVGSNEDALKLPCTEKIDLDGKLMLPGFVDAHLHCLHYAFVENSVKLFDCKSAEEALSLARTRIQTDSGKDIPWVFCRGWNEQNFTDKRFPTRQELDAICPDVPIIMVRVCGHLAISNTCGLNRLKEIPQFKDIERDTDFETGIIKENAVQFYYSVLDKPTPDQVEGYLSCAMKKLNEAGITGVQSDDLASLPGKDWHLILNAFHSLQDRNAMSVRFYEQSLFERFSDLKGFLQEGYRTGDGGEFFQIGPVKLIQDGSLGARTAALLEPYEGDPENKGLIIFEQDELNDIVRCCDEHHMQVAIHCIGDRAMDMVLTAFEKSSESCPRENCRHGIVHVQISNPDILERMKKQNIIAYIQPVFVDFDMGIAEDRIGADRVKDTYAWKTMLDMGIPVAGGSDAPVVSFNILENIYFAVTRKNIHGEPPEGWLPEQKVSVDEAVRMFTKYPAYSSFTEDCNGTIEAGKRADLAVLEKNIYEIPHDDIKNVSVSMTVVNGNIVFQRAETN